MAGPLWRHHSNFISEYRYDSYDTTHTHTPGCSHFGVIAHFHATHNSPLRSPLMHLVSDFLYIYSCNYTKCLSCPPSRHLSVCPGEPSMVGRGSFCCLTPYDVDWSKRKPCRTDACGRMTDDESRHLRCWQNLHSLTFHVTVARPGRTRGVGGLFWSRSLFLSAQAEGSHPVSLLPCVRRGSFQGSSAIRRQ